MEFIFDNPLYGLARESRLRNLFRQVDPLSLSGKRMLELGCGTGELGQVFVEAGCQVVSVDCRGEYLEEVDRRFPGRQTRLIDLENWDPAPLGKFDAVLCFGVLYHLSAPAEFLAACARAAPQLYLETITTDSADAVCPMVDEEGPDQASSGRGCRPSPAWLNQTLSELGFEVRDISTHEANWGGSVPSVFDWAPLGDGQWQRDGAMLRKMLICTLSPGISARR
jgi:cyclopropane fatty-acyl-phospholipid synthase-like methyltransferase